MGRYQDIFQKMDEHMVSVTNNPDKQMVLVMQ